jgi:hypothetical protein
MSDADPISKDDLEALEHLIDNNGIDRMLAALAEICEAKSAHVAENWQDRALAKRWAILGKALDRTVPKAGAL